MKKQFCHILSSAVVLAVTSGAAQAAKQWDSYTAITFTVSGSDDPLAPSNVGANGTQTHTYTIGSYDDVDHWIDPDEAPPNDKGYPDVSPPPSDIDYSCPESPTSLTFDGASTFTFTSPSTGGDFDIYFTGTDRDQVIGSGESGSRRDPDNKDNWWTLPNGD